MRSMSPAEYRIWRQHLKSRRLRFTTIRPLRDLRDWVRDFCATFRMKDMEQ